MTKPSDRAIAQAFWEERNDPGAHGEGLQALEEVEDRAREIDAAAPDGAQAVVACHRTITENGAAWAWVAGAPSLGALDNLKVHPNWRIEYAYTAPPSQDAEDAPDSDWRLKGYAYASKQATMCAGCGEHKHTPLRVDWMGGYVCLTCIDKEMEKRDPDDAAEDAARPHDVGTWLWTQLMDWCKAQHCAPATQDELFSIVERARKEFPSSSRQDSEDAALLRWCIRHSSWIRDDGRNYVSICVDRDADLSCIATTKAALEAARAARGGG